MPDPLKTRIAAVVQSLVAGDEETFVRLLGDVAEGETITIDTRSRLITEIKVSNPISHRPRTFLVTVSETKI
jgi:hypothetical protein